VNLDDLALSVSTMSYHTVIQHLSQLLRDSKLDQRTILCVLFALAVGFAIGRYRASRASSFQNRGEALLSHVALTNFGPPDYHLMNHVTLPMNDGTTQVDHILVSRFGVFVIEAKDYKGWIFANANQANWTQVLFNWKFRFQNPIFQNLRHVRAVRELLDFLPPGIIQSVVVFTGEAEFKTEVPRGVFSLPGFVEYVQEQKVEVMSLNRVQFCVGRIETARQAISDESL
jgi:hypothetical protein